MKNYNSVYFFGFTKFFGQHIVDSISEKTLANLPYFAHDRFWLCGKVIFIRHYL